MNARHYLIFVIVIAILLEISAFDPCDKISHAKLDDWKRSLRNKPTQYALCDSLLQEGWYRPTSNAGNEMPTTCPRNGFHCGTIEPIWLNGSYPPPGQIANVTACCSSYNGNCCKHKYPIQVKNCNTFYVYKLVKTTGCPQAYCFGKELPCRPGYVSPNGFSPGCKYEPCLSVNYDELDEWQRSVGNNKTSSPLCDSFLAQKWYKPISKAGNLMPTSCPKDGFRCGTLEPVWLNGSNPTTVNTTVNRTACASNVYSGCCATAYDIQIRNCGKFNVYKLKSTTTCPQAYCFGSEVPCEEGETSDTGFTPDCEFDPCYIKHYKTISGQVKRSSNYTMRSTDNPIDDSKLQAHWYRMDSYTGNDIVNSEQPPKQCGTNYPIWMKGTLPQPEDKTVKRKVCMTDGKDTCKVEWNIQIRNCNSFNVYLLIPASQKNAGYCFGYRPFVSRAESSTSLPSSKDIPWIVVVSLLVMAILVLTGLYIIKTLKGRTKKGSAVRDENPSPPYSPSETKPIQLIISDVKCLDMKTKKI